MQGMWFNSSSGNADRSYFLNKSSNVKWNFEIFKSNGANAADKLVTMAKFPSRNIQSQQTTIIVMHESSIHINVAAMQQYYCSSKIAENSFSFIFLN